MKIIYLHQHFNTPSGAGGLRSYRFAQALVERGHQVKMICGSFRGGSSGLHGPFIKGRREGIVDGIEVVEMAIDYSNKLSFLQRTIQFLRFSLRSTLEVLRDPGDIVFASSTPLTAAIPGIAARWIRQARFIFEVRDLWPELPREMGVITNPAILGLMSALEWTSYNSAYACIGLSPGIEKGILRRRRNKQHVEMLPNGCDLEIFHAEGIVPARPAKVPSEKILAIYAGTIGLANGVDAAVDAAEELVRRGDDRIHFLLIGDGNKRPDIERRIAASKLTNITLHDPVPKTEVANYLAGADIGLMMLDDIPAFYYGTSPNKFFDYMASGLPVIVNHPGWVADIINEHGTGIAIPPRDAAAFADALVRMADDAEFRNACRENGRRLASGRFGWPHIQKDFIEIIENTARPKSS